MPSDLDFRRAVVLGWFEYEETRGFCDYCRDHRGTLFGKRGYVLRMPDGLECRVGSICAQKLGFRVNGALLQKDPRQSGLEPLERTPRPNDRVRYCKRASDAPREKEGTAERRARRVMKITGR